MVFDAVGKLISLFRQYLIPKANYSLQKSEMRNVLTIFTQGSQVTHVYTAPHCHYSLPEGGAVPGKAAWGAPPLPAPEAEAGWPGMEY